MNLRNLFYPSSIALVGASERSIWSHMLHDNLVRLGYEGNVYAVNKTGSSTHGYQGYTSCTAIGHPVDAAYLFVPAEAVPDAFSDILKAGIKSVVILTSGFAESGEAGIRLQEHLVRMARDADAIFLGPNCLGYSNLAIRAPMTPAPNFQPVLPPRVALVSQSGATNAQVADLAHDLNIGISLYIATGNEAMLDIAACLDFLVDDEATRVIMVFAESIRDTQTFCAAARRAAQKRKAIVVLKVGTTELTAKVAAAHTGSLVGDDRVFDAACRQLGVIRVYTLEDLVVTAGLLAHTGPLTRTGIGVVSISGGACTLVADRAQVHGVDMPDFSQQTRERLRQIVPAVADPVNPFDITGVAMRDPAIFERALRAAADDAAIGLVLAVYEMPWNDKWHKVPLIESIGRAMTDLGSRGIVLNQMLRPITQKTRNVMAETGIAAVFGGIEAVMQALGRITAWSRHLERVNAPGSWSRELELVDAPAAWSRELKRVDAPAAGLRPAPSAASGSARANDIGAAPPARPVGERQLLGYLASAGVPVIPTELVTTRTEATEAAERIGFPVVLKVSSPDIDHKTEVGGVVLNLLDADAVGHAYDSILAKVRTARPAAVIEGVVVSPMRKEGVEILVGVTRDPQWGPVLTVGLGGIWVEVLADSQSLLLPATESQIKNALLNLRGARLLHGYRGSMPVDVDVLTRAVRAIGAAALTLGPGLNTLEVNPLLASGATVEALDALAVWDD